MRGHRRVAVACAIGALFVACGDDADPAAIEEGDGAASVVDTADGGMDGSAVEQPPEQIGIPPIRFDGGLAFPQTRVCSLRVGAECDGNEDCADGQVCCATFESIGFTYSSIACREQCAAPGGFRLCHPGEPCADPTHECRPSQLVPHDFIHVCFDPTGEQAPGRNRSIEGEVVCGESTCQVGSEKCCLRSWFSFPDNALIPLEPYCAPLDAACACTDVPPAVPPPPAGDLDAGTDRVGDDGEDAG